MINEVYVAPADEQLELLFAREYRRTVSLAGLLGATDPEDVAQEAFVRIRSKLGSLREPAAAAAYLRTTVLNATRSEHRREAIRSRLRGSDRLRFGPAVAPSAEDSALAVLPGRLTDLLRTLPRAQQEAIILRYWLDLPVDQIARELGVPVGTAKSHLSRALTALRKGMEQEDRL
jgi:RNA polymerase sigma factor (sigma-70 family)